MVGWDDFQHPKNSDTKSNWRRDKQQYGTWWLHHIIEIGAASFFFVPQFLKRLEGEHVLTLMASILPYMSGVCSISGPGAAWSSLQVSRWIKCQVSRNPLGSEMSSLHCAFSEEFGFQGRVWEHHALL